MGKGGVFTTEVCAQRERVSETSMAFYGRAF